MTDNIRNIIFDLGGVIVHLDAERCIKAFRQIGCGLVATYVEEHRTEDLFLDIELGHISTTDFCQQVRSMTGCDVADDRIVWAWNELLVSVDEEKKQRLLQLSYQYRLFLLSNTNEMHWLKCRDELLPYCHYDANDYFERIFLSYEMHRKKPDADIFCQTLHEAGIAPEETLFIDDSADNCRTAASLGIKTLHETSGNDWLGCL